MDEICHLFSLLVDPFFELSCIDPDAMKREDI